MNDDNQDIVVARQETEQNVIANLAQKAKNSEVLKNLGKTLEILRLAKPNERNELARRYAIAITEYEKLLAFFSVYVVDDDSLDV